MVTKNRKAESASNKAAATADPRGSAPKTAAPPPAPSAAPAVVAARSAVADPLLEQNSAQHSDERKRRRVVDEDDVTVTVPRAFRLQVAPGHIVKYEPGIQEMPKSHAEHQYAKDNGVEVYEKPKK